jgi:hypothetical protein
MPQILKSRQELKEWLNQRVWCEGKISEFKGMRVGIGLNKRRPAILIKPARIMKGKHAIELDHIWITPKSSRIKYEIKIGDIIRFSGVIYEYYKRVVEPEVIIEVSYGIKEVKNIVVLEYSEEGGMTYSEAFAKYYI